MNFTADYVSAHGQSWSNLLHPLRGRVSHMAEIGSFEGRSAIWFLDNVLIVKGSTMWCFDTWSGELAAAEKRFDENIASWSHEQHRLDDIGIVVPRGLKKTKGDAWEMAKLPAGFFDAIYVDGSHDGYNVLIDAVIAWRGLKVGGFLMFDDYGGGGNMVGVAPAVDSFIQTLGPRVEVLQRYYQVHLQKLSD